MPPSAHLPTRFGRFELQPGERRLLENGEPVSVTARAYDVLLVLVERAGQLVTKDELMERVWSRVIVEENTLQGQISILRKILGAGAIATVSGRGYRFTLATAAVGNPRVAATPRHNLPHQLTSFVGRARERSDLQELLRTSRMVTLTGAGGCGKTRLALEVASEVLHRYPDGVWLVALAPLADPTMVAQSVAQALGLSEQPGRDAVQAIAAHVKGKRLLVVLDNAEHVLVACAQISEAMLRAGSGVTLMATSRQPLGIAGEQTFRVPSLSVPPAEAATPDEVRAYESAQLFIERARQQRPGFEVTAANAPALAAICRQLDGIPLALELAAPRVRAMSVEEVSARLARTFKLLSAGSPTALPRQRTLRSLIDWSYDLLTEQEQALLCRLSVFAGGFLPEAAEHACSGDGLDAEDALEVLSSLCDKSLVVADEHDGITRYRLLATVRQYGHERLVQQGELDRWRERHFRYVLAFATEIAPLLVGPDQKAWLARLDTEHDNLRAALAWSAQGGGDPSAGLALARAIQDFWWLRQHLTEASTWLGEILAVTRDTPASVVKGRVMTFHGVILWQQGNLAAARKLHEQSADMGRTLGDRSLVASALGNLAFVLTGEGDHAGARALQEEILAMRRAEGDPRRIATALSNLAVGCRSLGDHASARALLEEGLAISRTLGHGPTVVTALQNLAIVALDQDDLTAALALGTECLATARELGDRRIEAMALNLVGGVLCRQGDLEQGEAHLRQSLATHDPGAVSDMIEICDTLATACSKVKPVRAARIWGGVERLRAESGHRKPPLNERDYVRHVAEARQALADDAAFAAAWQEGRRMSLGEIVAYARGDA